MKVDLGIWDKLTKLVIFLLFLAGLVGLAVWYLPLIKQNVWVFCRVNLDHYWHPIAYESPQDIMQK